MASSAIAVVGEYERDWADFGVATNFFAFKGYCKAVDGFVQLLRTASALWISSRMATGQRNPARSSLLVLLWLADGAKARDPRDKGVLSARPCT